MNIEWKHPDGENKKRKSILSKGNKLQLNKEGKHPHRDNKNRKSILSIGYKLQMNIEWKHPHRDNKNADVNKDVVFQLDFICNLICFSTGDYELSLFAARF